MRKLSPQDKFKLVDKLLACRSVRNRDSRETILRQLPDQIRNAVENATRDDFHITNLVDACLGFPGGVEELIGVVQYYEKNSVAMQELDKLQDEIFPRIVKSAQLRELKLLVAKIRWPARVLIASYRASAPPGLEWSILQGSNEVETCSFMVDRLVEAPRQDSGNVPILVFVEQLARHLDERPFKDKLKTWAHIPWSFQDKLRTWIYMTAKEQGFEKPKFDDLDDIENSSSVPPLKITPYLLITLRPDVYDQRLFGVQAWLFDEYRPIHRLDTDDEQRPLADIPPLLDDLLTQSIFYLMEAMDRLTIEFSLPRALMCCDVDHWIVNAGRSTLVKIGIQHRVVVRSLERSYDKKLWPFWKSKWIKVQSHLLRANGNDNARFLIFGAQDCEQCQVPGLLGTK